MVGNKLFLFDIDGVVNQASYFTIPYSKEFNVPLDAFDDFFEGEFFETLKGNVLLEEVLGKYLHSWNWKNSIENFLNYWFSHDVKLDTNVISEMKKLKTKGYRIGVASQQEKRRRDFILNEIEKHVLLDVSYFSCDLHCLKSSNMFYQMVNRIESSEIYFWEDTLSNVKIAALEGWNSFFYQGESRLRLGINQIVYED